MWVVSAFKPIKVYNLKKGEAVIIIYNKLFYYYLRCASLIKKHCFFYCSPHLVKQSNLRIGFEQTTIRFKYNGKAYRVSRKKKILQLNFHYPTYKYLIWSNIKLKHFKKRKKLFKITTNTFSSFNINLHNNLYTLRPLNTYTKRGIYLSNCFFYQRKPKTSTKR